MVQSGLYSRSLLLASVLLLQTTSFFSTTTTIVSATSGGGGDDDNFNGCINRELTYPKVIDMDDLAARDETLTMDLRWISVNPGFGDSHGYQNDPSELVCGSTVFDTRALGGSVPGPTLTVSPGTTMKILFRNQLTYQRGSFSSRVVVEGVEVEDETDNTEATVVQQLLSQDGGAVGIPSPPSANTSNNNNNNNNIRVTNEVNLKRLNRFNDPDVANLHFHGLHISSVLPSDDVSLEVLPQEDYEYTIRIPEDHEPGMHWAHPHHHGSSTLQRVGGAAIAIIIKDPQEKEDWNGRKLDEDDEEVDEEEDDTVVEEDAAAAEAEAPGSVSTNPSTTFNSATPVNSKMLLPSEVRKATERIMVFQEWDIHEALLVARMAGDTLLEKNFERIVGGESIGQRFVTINGKYQPITSIRAGVWERWRFLYAGWQDLPMEFGMTLGNGADCEFYLLAKDGMYIADYPRGPMVSDTMKIPMPPGGRADFMVRCNKVDGTTRFEALSRRNVLIVNCVENVDNGNVDNGNVDNDNDNDNDNDSDTEGKGKGEGETAATNNVENETNANGIANDLLLVEGDSSTATAASVIQRSSSPLTPWKKHASLLPDYLQDLSSTVASDGCTCTTAFDGYDDTSRVNGEVYRTGNNFMHTSYVGATVERHLKGMNEHSYHQHVYPFQVVDFPNKEDDQNVYGGSELSTSTAYFKAGDWHDTYLDKTQNGKWVTIRYKVTDYPGKMMVHCHNTLHSDRGIMQKEYMRDGRDGSDYCRCDIFGPIDGPGIVDDINSPHVIGGIDVLPASSSATMIMSTIATTAGRLLFLATAAASLLLA